MKRKISNMQIAICGLSLIPVIILLLVYDKLPPQVITNWGFNGEVSYGDKSTMWLITGMAPVLGILFYILPKIDPRKSSYKKFSSSYEFFQVVMQLFFIILTGLMVIENLKPGTINIATVVTALCGILFIVIGNMMPKFRQNFFCGIKTPWTLSNEEVWTKTHRLGGRMMFVAGVIAFIGAFLPGEVWKMAAIFVPVLTAAIVPGVMSYIWFQKINKEE